MLQVSPFPELTKVARRAWNVCTNGVIVTEYPISSWDSRTLVHAKQRVATWPAPDTNPEHWVFNELSRERAFHMHCDNPLLQESSASCVTPLGEDSESLCRVSPRLHLRPFHFAVFLCILFAVINHSHKYDSMLHPVILLQNHHLKLVSGYFYMFLTVQASLEAFLVFDL